MLDGHADVPAAVFEKIVSNILRLKFTNIHNTVLHLFWSFCVLQKTKEAGEPEAKTEL